MFTADVSESSESKSDGNEDSPIILEFIPFNKNGEVVIEEIWNMEVKDELIVFGFVRQFESFICNYTIIPQTISYTCLAFYANGNALDRNVYHYYDFDPLHDVLYHGKFSMTYKCIKCGITYDDNELNKIEQFEDDENNKYEPFNMSNNKLIDNSSNDDIDKIKEYLENNIFVLKKLKKELMSEEDIISCRKEIEFLKQIRRLKTKNIAGSQYINKLVDLFEDKKYSYIITDFCNGDNLWTFMETEPPQYARKNIMRQILSGVEFLHSNNILHLSLQPLNILLHQENSGLCVQIIKFFDSKYMDCMNKSTNVSSFMNFNFISPEIINGYFDNKSDVWNIGIIFFLLQFGFQPFFLDDDIDYDEDVDIVENKKTLLYAKIQKGFNPVTQKGFGAWFPLDECDEHLKDLIGNMLQIDTSKRFTIKQCLKHSYFH